MRCRAGAVFASTLLVLVASTTACASHTTSHRALSAPGPTGNDVTPADMGSSNARARIPAVIATPGVHTPSGPTSTVPASIASNCSTDVTDALQQWFDSVPDGSVAALRQHGCYRIEGMLVLDSRNNLLIDGHGATLRATTVGTGNRLQVRQRSQLAITRSTNITVRDLVVRGANPHAGTADDAYQPRYEAQHAFALGGDNGVFLDRVQAYDVYGDFVYIGNRGRVPSTDVTVARSRFARNGRQGISITDATDVAIVGNEIDDVRRSLFDIELNRPTATARRIVINANTIGAVHNYWLANKGEGSDIGDVTVENNVTQAPSGALVIVFGPPDGERGPFRFTGNVFRVSGAVTDEGAAGLFLFSYARGVTVSGNTVFAASSANLAALELRATSAVTIEGNHFNGTTKPVIADAASHDVHARQ